MTSYTDTLQRGDMISCYQIEDVLGRGGFAVTYLAIDLNLDVHVAIKEYLPREIIQRDEQLNVSASRPEFIDDYNIGLSNFAREAKTLARFKHLNIVRVHQVIHKYNTAYMVMDYEQGQELSDVLADQQTLSEDDLRSILFPIFDGVDEIHRAGLAHRDIKPSNIYLRENGSPVLLDFGAARYTMSETTQQLTAVVTVGYTPIEQYNVSDNDQGPWSDIYALAAVLYEAVTGSMPVDSVTRASSTLTRSEDPLASVSNKAQQHYSEEFLNAIDWGLKMEAEDRPQSIAQWRDAFNGEVKPASDYVRKRPPARPSRLRTRASEPLALTDPAPAESAHPYQSDPRLTEEIPDPRLSVDVRDTRFDPRFDDNIDEIEIVPLNTIEPEFSDDPAQSLNVEPAASDSQHHELHDDAGDTVAPIRSLERQPSSGAPANTPRSAFASNPVADGTNRDAAGDEPTVRHDGQNHQEPTDNLTLNDTLNNIANNPGQTTHTQELRNVLRRDIVKRNPSPGAEAGRERNPYPQPYRVAKAEQDGTAQDAAAARLSPYPRPLQAEHANEHQSPPLESRPMRSPPVRDDIQFDESDWDYEPPAPPSKLRWLLPAAGLVGVVGASLLFVNKPEMFKLPTAATPELSVSAALEKAQLQMNEEAFIFPEGQSALDYFRLILSSDPDNIDAQIGVSKLQDAVKLQIIDSIESDDLEGANRLLTRANETGLQIDGLPGSSIDVSSSVLPENTGPIAIDTNQSPWVTGKIADIERLISEQRFAEAKTLFDNTDQYVADAELSNRMKRQIEAGINGTANQSSAPESGDTIVTPVIPSPVVETQPVATTEIELPAAGTEQAIIPEPTTDATEVLARPSNNSSNSTISSSVTTVSSDPTASDADQKIALNDTPETLPSAPRRSFIEGNDATARHLNQLRTAIEAKSLRRVLDVSNSLPEERTEFLRKMFQRYDRLDVTIDDINTASDSATARLSVSMFNQRGDGSFYSAGKWNGVTLETDRRNGVWQKIQW